MQKAKKIMSLLLAIAMLAVFAVPSAFAVEFSDVPESYQYYDAVQSLVARGIVDGYTDGTFKPEDTISRAEFCKMVVYSIGMGETSQGAVTETGFPDVAADFWAAGVIKVARDMNIINGYDDGTFKPDEKVTYDQAIKMVVCAKSEKFATAAQKNGGFPTGYRKVATAYNFVKNITDGVYNDPAKRGTIAKLIDNMLNIKMSDITDDSSAIDPSAGMEEIKGQVVAVYGASLDSKTSALTKYQVMIALNSGETKTYNGENLSVKNDLRSYLGKMVVAYYKEDIGLSMQKLSSLNLQKNKNSETIVDVADIAEYTATSLSYYNENSETKKISVSSSAKILYNGLLSTKKFADAVAECENQSGSIRFLSTSGEGGTAEVVFFTVYKNIVVTSVTASSKLVYGEDVAGKVEKYEINDSDVNKNVTITKNGSSVSFSAIAKNQVLSISESDDKTQIEVLIGPDAVTGRVSAMTRGEKEITIGSKTYKFATGVTMGTDIEVGANLKLYLDVFNKIAKYEFQAASVTYTYAYLTKIANVGTGMDAYIRVELINLSGSSIKDATYYTLADKVTINNKTYRPSDDFATIKQLLIDSAKRYTYTNATGKNFGAETDEVHQPLKYTLSNGKINTLLIGKDDATDADLRYDRSALDSKDGFKCTTDKVGLAGQYTLNSSTKVLYVPANPDQANISKYTLRTGTNSGFNADAFYRVVLVDLNQSKTTPALVLVYSTGSSAPTSSDWVSCQPGVVTKVSSVENADTITVIDASGNETVYYDEDKEFSGKVAIGDVIRLSVDASKNIEDMELLASGSQVYTGKGYLKTYSHQDTKNMQNDESGNVVLIREGSNISQDTAQSWLALGTAFEVQDSTLKMSLGYLTTSGKDDIELGNKGLLKSMSASGAKMISVNFAKDGTVKNVDAKNTEIGQLRTYKTATTDADKIFVYRSYGTTKLIVVFRAEQ